MFKLVVNFLGAGCLEKPEGSCSSFSLSRPSLAFFGQPLARASCDAAHMNADVCNVPRLDEGSAWEEASSQDLETCCVVAVSQSGLGQASHLSHFPL